MDFEALAPTLFCGQCFRWRKLPDGSYEGIAGDRYAHITRESLPELLKDGFWADYFDTGLDYGAVRRDFCRLDPVLARAVRFAPEIRILKQDPWEALCTFLLSQCNNIGRIRGMVERLCASYGAVPGGGALPEAVSDPPGCTAPFSPPAAKMPAFSDPDPCYPIRARSLRDSANRSGGDRERTLSAAFPGPEKLAGAREEDLRALGFGYRAPYVVDAARRVASGEVDFGRLHTLPLDAAREELCRIRGVGPKVADCTLLYGLHRLEAFPLDVWTKRAMHRLFPGRKTAWFGPYAGIAQQYLFHYSRCHPELFRESSGI